MLLRMPRPKSEVGIEGQSAVWPGGHVARLDSLRLRSTPKVSRREICTPGSQFRLGDIEVIAIDVSWLDASVLVMRPGWRARMMLMYRWLMHQESRFFRWPRRLGLIHAPMNCVPRWRDLRPWPDVTLHHNAWGDRSLWVLAAHWSGAAYQSPSLPRVLSRGVWDVMRRSL